MLDWMALGAGGPRTSTIELALESTGLLLYLLALMLVLCRVVEAGFIIGFGVVSSGNSGRRLSSSPLGRVRSGGGRLHARFSFVARS
jgi:hypothetical protein